MHLSVVVPTLNACDRLEASLDALAEHAPDAEVVVVNGPSSDGTSGMVRDHPATDALLELSERNLNTARNAGIAAASGEVVALVGQDSRIEADWVDAVEDAIETGADVVTGPVHRRVNGGVTTEAPETRSLGSRTVDYFDGGNVAFQADVLETLDGFDQYLHTGGARDAAHRLAGIDATVTWDSSMVVLREEADDVIHRIGDDDMRTILGLKYRSLGYRLAKNYGVTTSSVFRSIRHPFVEAVEEGWNVIRGETKASEWIATGRAVATNLGMGFQDGLAARSDDQTPRRNPNGVSAQTQRPISTYTF
jgi:glycosyltransferase involved in cell wall biosynthesis